MNLIRLVEVAAKINSPLARDYVDDVFGLAEQDSPDWPAADLQRAALILLSAADPERAFELLSLMEPPPQGAEGDPRSEAAAVILPHLWARKGRPALDGIRLQAQRLGEAGHYPYAGMAPVMSTLFETEPATAESLFLEAVTYYRRRSPSFSTDKKFLGLLRSAKGKVRAVLMRDAVQVALACLLEKAKRESTAEKTLYRARLHTEKGVVTFENRAEELLFSLLPLLRELDPERAERLLQERPALAGARSAVGEVQHRESALIHVRGRADKLAISAAEQKALEQSRFAQIRGLAKTDPEQALTLSLTLQDPGLRAAAFGYLAATAAPQDRDKATHFTSQARELLPQVKSPIDKVRSLASLARATAALGDNITLRRLLAEGLDLGVEVFEQEMDTHPGWTTFHSEVIEHLSELVQVNVRTDLDATVAYVQGLQNDPLKAWLLLDIAEVVGTSKPTQRGPADQSPGAPALP